MISKRGFIFFFLLISFALFLTTPRILLFYDAPEFVRIISENGFCQSLGLGHQPIHPFFIAVLWLISRLLRFFGGISWEYSANLSAFVFGIVSIFLFFQLSKFFLKEKGRYLALLIFCLFPAVWIINTNLMVESLLLTFFLLSSLLFLRFLEKPKKLNALLYILSVVAMFGVHIQAIFWLPALFAFPFLLRQRPEQSKRKNLLFLLSLSLFSLLLSILLYALIFAFSGQNVVLKLRELFFARLGEHFDFFSIDGIFRMLRNFLFSLLRGFGSLTPIIVLVIAFLKRKEKFFLFGCLLFIISLFILGAVWTGDFMMRRTVFAGVLFALLIVQRFSKKAVFLLLYLLPIALANGLLYVSTRADMPLVLMHRLEKGLPPGNVLIQTHYHQPFTFYDGRIFWVGQDNFQVIEDFLAENKKVFIDFQAVLAPYMLYVGNNLHITSLARFGVSETKELFKDYIFDLAVIESPGKRIFVYSLKKRGEDFEERLVFNKEKALANNSALMAGRAEPGSAVLFYSKNFFQRIRRERIDYGDLLTWIWVIVSAKHEPIAWTYADADGVYLFPINSQDSERVFVSGEGVELD